MNSAFEASIEFVQRKDKEDKLARFKNKFFAPHYQNKPVIYFCSNSLGLQPVTAASAIGQELLDWQEKAIGGYYGAKNPWLFYQDYFTESLSKLAGCKDSEVTVMNSLTVNLHLLMISFYNPKPGRYKILMEAGAFPSDQYAVETQVKLHKQWGNIPAKDEAIIEIFPREGEKLLREEDIISKIEKEGNSIALVLLGGINYYTGQFLDIEKITAAAHKANAIAAFDLAHAIGNVKLNLHEWNVDFAIWCSYKYLNAGPGAVGGVFIHERFAKDSSLPRLGGWWGNNEETRFKMEKGFIPKDKASGWNISTAQVFNMAALKAAMEIYDEAGIDSLREKSVQLTGFLEFLMNQLTNLEFEIITPSDPERRGAQLSLYFKSNGPEILAKMKEAGIVVDYREPGVIRVAPNPFYNSFEEVFQFYKILENFRH
ncbi:MAG: kynureninase [Bacteroidetes bacterium]|nr:MAG: kynureninase [Bacteroidota bacterium]